MPGIRLQHPTARSARYTVVEPEVPYTSTFTCTPPELGGCGGTHLFKTHHLNLDSEGNVIVSTGVYARIKDRLALDGFILGNEVAKPPPIGLSMDASGLNTWGQSHIPIIHSPNSIERS
jgi:hypothetical protein